MRTRRDDMTLNAANRTDKSEIKTKQAERGRHHSIRYSRFTLIIVALLAAGAVSILGTQFGNVVVSGGLVSAATEAVTTTQADYTTPKTTWNLGETAHARIDDAPLPTTQPFLRRVVWIAPDGSLAQINPVTANPGTDDYSIPTSGQFAQVGTWTVKTIDNRGVGHAFTRFTVLSATEANADLSITKSGPTLMTAGNDVTYTVTVTNNGPDAAQNVQMQDRLPDNTSFVSETQASGPTATCSTLTLDDVTTTVCSIASLQANESATFMLVYNVGSGVQNGTVIVNTATVSSSTNEVDSVDNSASATTLIGNTPPPTPCTINCPADITQDNDPNQCSAIVSYSNPVASGNCQDENGQTPAVVCSPPSGSAFPVGSTAVTCSVGGTACSFTITVHDMRPPVQPTISCPSNVTASEDSPGSGSGIVNYPSPTTTGNCVVVVCTPPSGSAFNVGTTTVNCTGTDSANNSVTCSFNVTVVSGNCTLTCPGDVTQTASSGCSAVVNYSSPTTSGTCGNVTCNPPSGSAFPVGTSFVTCNSDQGPTCSFVVTVIAPAPPTIVTCASNKSVAADANCEGVIPNLLGEVVTTGCNVIKSQSPAAGSVVGSGIYTVTITAENSAGQVTCTATVTIDNQAPVITTCPAPSSGSVGSNCQAAVPNVTGSVVASDNCTPTGSLTITQSPAAGTMVGIGTTTITVTVKDAVNNSATCQTTFTANGPQVTGLGTAQIWVGLKNSDDVGTKFDLLAEVLRNGSVVGSGQINDVAGGSSGFNNAVLDTISLALSGPVNACSGDTLSIRLSVRVAASSGHVSGTARLWFNDSAANSSFSATVAGATGSYYLLDGFVLGTSAGPGPKKTIDVLVNRNQGGNPFKPFGTWTKTL